MAMVGLTNHLLVGLFSSDTPMKNVLKYYFVPFPKKKALQFWVEEEGRHVYVHSFFNSTLTLMSWQKGTDQALAPGSLKSLTTVDRCIHFLLSRKKLCTLTTPHSMTACISGT